MARPKLEIQRERLSMRIDKSVMRYLKVKSAASAQGLSPNILIEDAMEMLLENTIDMSRMEIFDLVSTPVRTKRIPISIMIKGNTIERIRELAKRASVPFAQVVEKSVAMTIQTDIDDIEAGRLESKIIEEACAEYFSTEQKLSRKTPLK